MTQMEITALEHAGRSAMAWSPEGYDGRDPSTALCWARWCLPSASLPSPRALLFVAFLRARSVN